MLINIQKAIALNPDSAYAHAALSRADYKLLVQECMAYDVVFDTEAGRFTKQTRYGFHRIADMWETILWVDRQNAETYVYGLFVEGMSANLYADNVDRRLIHKRL